MEQVTRLEEALVEWTGMPYVVACSSGTAALHLALEALQLPQDSEVIVPDYTMVACPRAAAMAGLTPRFVDCGRYDLLMNNATSMFGLCSRTSAIMAVHIYGRQCNVPGLLHLHRPIIEDMAELHGVLPHFRTDAACWSFYKNKLVHGEEGGCVGFRNKEHADLARSLRCLGFTEAHDYTHRPRGCNYRLAESLAEKVQYSLQDFYRTVKQRRTCEAWCDELCPEKWLQPARQSPWVYDIRIPGLQDQRELVTKLNAKGIAARYGFKRMTCLEEYRIPGLDFTEAAVASREVLYLPLTLYQDQVRLAFSILAEAAKEFL